MKMHTVFNHHDIMRNACMLHGPLAHCGYDWWWHSFTAQDAETGEEDEELTLDEAKAVSGGSFSCNCTTMGVGVIGTEMDMPGTFGDGK